MLIYISPKMAKVLLHKSEYYEGFKEDTRTTLYQFLNLVSLFCFFIKVPAQLHTIFQKWTASLLKLWTNPGWTETLHWGACSQNHWDEKIRPQNFMSRKVLSIVQGLQEAQLER